MRKTRWGAVVVATAAVTAVTAGCGTGTAATPTDAAAAPARPTEQQIAGLFPQWNAALATGDPQRVADLYAPDAVLLPTVSNEVRRSRAEIVDYFTKFLQSKPQGVIENEIVDVLDADTAVNTGVYEFTLTKDGKSERVRARYTYVYELREGKWLIVNHHSSAMPEG
ncbi:SgcJ/EcaC family oxidoreductase [Amycolatopsis sp.]|uniref:SgcJ/EcaC family oxidoreductase n=1 Tax=Amycolatopsis sp. TaxID=37632 RepID=UPI002D806C5C|nr:SgcJ/EcaC family oxidoreductase [Amycolatopsis sp.]HET6707783.1 SgcJ/EcaC family oxidoreductase [Amycolatopsis sp.]